MGFEELKTKIADSAAISDIECHCSSVLTNSGRAYNISSAGEEDKEWVDDAVAYLSARGLITVDGNTLLFKKP